MERLTKKEEPIMQIVWDEKKVFINDIINKLPEPKPPYNTVSSIVRVLEAKGMVGHETFGRTHRYYALISKTDYRKSVFTTMVKDYFDGSHKSLLSYIVDSGELTKKDFEELKKLVKDKNDD